MPALGMQPRLGTMLLWIVPGLIAVALFVATLSLRPHQPRATLLPPPPRCRAVTEHLVR
jgi:hypothetical protein